MQEDDQKRKLVTIVNAERLGEDLKWVKSLWSEHFPGAKWVETKNWNEARATAACYIGMAEGAPLYLQSIGGDGSHSALANAYLDRTINSSSKSSNHNIILGLVPAGSGNDISRALGFNPITKLKGKKKRTIEKYLDPLKQSQNINYEDNILHMDAGLFTLYNNSSNKELKHFFVNCFGLGYFANVNKEIAHKDEKNKKYTRTLLELQKEHNVNGAFNFERLYSTIQGAIGLNNYEGHALEVINSKDFGGRVRINPEANISDGSMEMFIVKSARRRHILRNLLKVKLNTNWHLTDSNILYNKGVENIGTHVDKIETLQADGEVIETRKGMYNQINVKVLPSALPVVTAYVQK